MIRLAALAAVDAKPISYLAHVGPPMESGVTLEDVQNGLVAVAPIIGTARTLSASVNIAEALGFAPARVREGIEDPDVKQALRANTDAALSLGVVGVPTLQVAGELFWGDDRLDEAADLARRAGWS